MERGRVAANPNVVRSWLVSCIDFPDPYSHRHCSWKFMSGFGSTAIYEFEFMVFVLAATHTATYVILPRRKELFQLPQRML
jgi:hypothetical protein